MFKALEHTGSNGAEVVELIKKETEYREFLYLESKGYLVDDDVRHYTFEILKNENL